MPRIQRSNLPAERSENIPKGLRPSAQRCRDGGAATLGHEPQSEINPEGVEPMRETAMQPSWGWKLFFGRLIQGSSFLATQG